MGDFEPEERPTFSHTQDNSYPLDESYCADRNSPYHQAYALLHAKCLQHHVEDIAAESGDRLPDSREGSPYGWPLMWTKTSTWLYRPQTSKVEQTRLPLMPFNSYTPKENSIAQALTLVRNASEEYINFSTRDTNKRLIDLPFEGKGSSTQIGLATPGAAICPAERQFVDPETKQGARTIMKRAKQMLAVCFTQDTEITRPTMDARLGGST